MQSHIHTLTCIHTHIHTLKYTFKYTHTNIYTHSYTHSNIYTHAHSHIYIHTHSHVHIYSHIHTPHRHTPFQANLQELRNRDPHTPPILQMILNTYCVTGMGIQNHPDTEKSLPQTHGPPETRIIANRVLRPQPPQKTHAGVPFPLHATLSGSEAFMPAAWGGGKWVGVQIALMAAVSSRAPRPPRDPQMGILWLPAALSPVPTLLA